jgi:hypothetical protein
MDRTAEGNGYPHQAYNERAPGGRGNVFALEPGGHIRDIVFALIPAAVITGTVYDEDGNPVVGALVEAIRHLRPGGSQRIVSAQARTNDLGEYRLFGLAPRQYLVMATGSNIILRTGNRKGPNGATDNPYLPTFYLNTPDVAQAAVVEALAGQELSEININLIRARGVRASGSVLSAVKSKSVQGAYVELFPCDSKISRYLSGNYWAGVPQEKGTFEIRGAPPGSYSLVANLNEAGTTYSGHTPLDAGTADIEGITVVLSPNADLRGRVRTDPRRETGLHQIKNLVTVWRTLAERSRRS